MMAHAERHAPWRIILLHATVLPFYLAALTVNFVVPEVPQNALILVSFALFGAFVWLRFRLDAATALAYVPRFYSVLALMCVSLGLVAANRALDWNAPFSVVLLASTGTFGAVEWFHAYFDSPISRSPFRLPGRGGVPADMRPYFLRRTSVVTVYLPVIVAFHFAPHIPAPFLLAVAIPFLLLNGYLYSRFPVPHKERRSVLHYALESAGSRGSFVAPGALFIVSSNLTNHYSLVLTAVVASVVTVVIAWCDAQRDRDEAA